MRVRISEVVVGPRKRKLGDVAELAKSIAEVGLLQPIVVTKDMRLIAGLHRLEACKRLGWETIEARVATLDDLGAELAEIDENLMRTELTLLERGEHFARRQEIYEALHPEAKAGYKRAAGMHKALGRNVGETVSPTFAADTAAKTGLSPRTIQQDVQIATKIAPDVRDAIRHTSLANSKRDLLDLARKAPEEQRQIVSKVLAGEAAAVKVAAQLVKRESLPPPPQPVGEYDVILADPPWQYEFAETISRAIENQYPTMDLDEITRIRVPSAENAALFLWATAPKLKEALEVMEAWGFTYRTCAVWDKERIGMGYWFRVQHELLLVGTKGNFRAPAPFTRVSSVIRSPRHEHSRKPEIVYEILENMFPNARFLELFARHNSRPRWTAWGNEAA